ncbi:LlaJI family restriction endonuclease [Bacillus pumilus]|uniref:LlaJI family restriction endonuclease n=1 Tax=Bacillus TaxID=1386 RepID=UPI003000C93B
MKQVPNYTTKIEYIEYINDYPQEFTDQLINKGICRVSENKIKFIATGVLIYKNSLVIIFPKAYKVPTEDELLKEHIQILFNVLLRYRREAKLTAEEMNLLGGENGQLNGNLFTSYSLIQDFTQNGLLMKEIKIKDSTISGHIDWSATISKKQPMISIGSVIYTDPISRKTIIDRQHQLLIIHKYCVYKSLEKYGWLFGVTSDNANLDVTELNCDINYAISFLTKELNSTFIEREINTIKMIMNFLLGIEQKGCEEQIETLVTPYFQNVWEQVCSTIFNNQYKILKKIIPKLKWEIDSPAIVQPQRPDIIMLRRRTMYILDAKYYNSYVNLPGWHDVVKQLFYAITIFNNINSKDFRLHDKKLEKKVKEIIKVENVFLFPSEEEEPIKYVGKVNIERNQDFDDIRVYKLNTFFVMKCYIGKGNYDYINSLEEITACLNKE